MVVVSGLSISTANAHCKGKHADYEPHCGGGTEPPDPGGSADPQVVYREGGANPATFLANFDGSNRTQIWDAGIIGHLDSPGKRVLFQGDGLDLLTYENVNGSIGNITHDVLVSETQINGKFSAFGITDWSPDGTKYAYSYYRTGDPAGAVYGIMLAPEGVDSEFIDHTVIYEGAPGSGLGGAAWDASGNYIYLIHSANPNGASRYIQVIDVSTGEIVVQVDFDPFNGGGILTPQSQSASFMSGAYSFSPGIQPDTLNSLCLVVANAEWGAQPNANYSTWIIDLPAVFDPNAISGAHCPLYNVGSPIPGFQGRDFTTNDVGLVGEDFGKPRPQGIHVYDLTELTLSRIVKDGRRPDWSN
jgi:hypothetical protein